VRGCDLFMPGECPREEKCIVNEDATYCDGIGRCVPLARDPNGLGEPCTLDRSEAWNDDCDAGLLCWYVDAKTQIGTCLPFCSGEQFVCPESYFCVAAEAPPYAICLPWCDPLLQDCAEGRACYAGRDVFLCAPDASGDEGQAGDACGFVNDCDPGLACVSPEWVAGCEGLAGCCTPFCDLGDPDPPCNEIAGEECVAWYEDGQAPPGFDHVGVCRLP